MNNKIALAKSQQQRAITKAAQTLLGICSGITADGQINDAEITFLRTWLAANPDAASTWPGSAIVRRIDDILSDGIITQEERDSLILSLQQISGHNFHETGTVDPASASLPIDDDPSIFFRNMTFCFTGNFHYGTRANCERAVMKLEAMPVDSVSSKVDYLVIGAVISENWVHTSYGRKIELAITRQKRFGKPTIISEAQWVAAMEEATQ